MSGGPGSRLVFVSKRDFLPSLRHTETLTLAVTALMSASRHPQMEAEV